MTSRAVHHVDVWVSDLVDEPHDRLRPGVNHLAFTVASRELVVD